ncbi:MAG: class I SAM-dependent methyltransferase [Spirochaetales bacterium]|nr:class I SAM-dependent methyltransferase [Spirochaetales bacterium]
MNKNRQDKEKKFWNKFANKYDNFLNNLKDTYDLLIKKINQYMDPSKNVLEIATGTGIISLEIARNAKRVCGCDISEEMVKTARSKLKNTQYTNIEFDVQDAYHLTYEQESFDIVIASNVLHVLIQPEKALQSIHNVLKPKGIFIAPTYCHGNSAFSRIISFIMSLAGFKAYQKWSIESFRDFLESKKYRIIEFEVIKDKIPLVFAVVEKV